MPHGLVRNLVDFPQEALYDLEFQMIEGEPDGFFPLDKTTNWGSLRQTIASILQESLEQLVLVDVEADVEASQVYLSDWELMLKLPPNPANQSLTARRGAILAAIQQTGFTRTAIRRVVELYLESSSVGDAVQLTPGGVSLGAGVPLFSGIVNVEDAYVVWEDVVGFEYTLRIDSAVTLPSSATRALTTLTPGGITLNIESHANPNFTTNLFSEPELDNLPSDAETDNTGWEELTTEWVYVGTNSLQIHPRDIGISGSELVFRIINKTFANSISGVSFRILIPEGVWPTGHMRLKGANFTNDVINQSLMVDMSKTNEWQEIEGYWVPGADFIGDIRLEYNGKNMPPGMGTYLTDGDMETAGVANWLTGGANTRSKITTSPTPWRRIQALEVIYQDNDFLAYQTMTLDAAEAIEPQIWLTRVYIPAASDPTSLVLDVRDFGNETGSQFTVAADVSIKDTWQTLKLEWTPPEDTPNDLVGNFMIRAAGLSASDKIIVDGCSANNDDQLCLFIDDIKCGVLA